MAEERITLGDIETKIRGVQGSASRSIDAVRPAMPSMLGLAVGGVAFIAFVLGYRRGRSKSSVIEIQRI
ncbi:MAG: hypothetical protein ACYDHP_06460 [Ferrimicrobium sp.]